MTVTDLESNLTYSKEILLEKTVERKQLKPGQTPLGSRSSAVLDAIRATQGMPAAAPQAAPGAPEQLATPQGVQEEHRDAQAERGKGKTRR